MRIRPTIRALANYSDEYKAILFRVPKCANCSLKTVFSKNTYHNKLQEIHKLKKRMGSKYDSYFKLAFVRNPYDRLVSCWKSKTSMEHYKGWPSSPFAKAVNTSFLEFINMIREDHINKNDRHIIPQVCLVPQDIDFIGRFETIQKDFNTVCTKLGITQCTLPHKNKSKHTHYTEYYDDETIEIVTKMYKEDLEVFGYEFGK